MAAQQVVAQADGKAPARTWMTGISHGGHLTRWQLENRPELDDGGLDWEGSLFQGAAPNLLTYLPTGMRTSPGTPTACDTHDDYATRPPSVRAALDSVQVTGAIDKPMLTLHGDLDALLPIKTDSDVNVTMLRVAGKGELHRYSVIEGGNPVDGLVVATPTALRPILSFLSRGLPAADQVGHDRRGSAESQTVARPASGDLASTCTAPPGGDTLTP